MALTCALSGSIAYKPLIARVSVGMCWSGISMFGFLEVLQKKYCFSIWGSVEVQQSTEQGIDVPHPV